MDRKHPETLSCFPLNHFQFSGPHLIITPGQKDYSMVANVEQVVVLGLNPAWQKTLVFPEFQPGEVNRAHTVAYMAAGKGANACRAIKTWGGNALLIQFAGGENGRNLQAYLAEEGISYQTVTVAAETRGCTTCLCEKTEQMTELIEPSGKISENAVAELLDNTLHEISGSAGLAICGTYPPGVTADFYSQAANVAQQAGCPVLLDACRDIEPVLHVGVDVLKINQQELFILTGENSCAGAVSSCFKQYPLKAIALTAGAQSARLFTRQAAWSFALPSLDKIINPLGAGDTVSGIMLAEIAQGRELPDAFAQALAAGSASCLAQGPGCFDLSAAKKMREEIEITSG